jgi:hypothetical protein
MSVTNRRSVTVTLTPQELTDIRVSVLTRLDLIGKRTDPDETPAEAAERQARYERVRALMAEGGVLHRAMIESLAHGVKEVT